MLLVMIKGPVASWWRGGRGGGRGGVVDRAVKDIRFLFMICGVVVVIVVVVVVVLVIVVGGKGSEEG